MPNSLLKLALSPLLALQALRVRQSALLLPEAQGARQGETGQGKDYRLLILGDSSAAGVGADHQAQALSGQLAKRLGSACHLTWHLETKTGATTASTLSYLNKRPPQSFDGALVILGVNDVTRLTAPSRWQAQQDALHVLLQQKFAVNHIFRSGLPPMGQFPLLPQPLRFILGADAAALDATLAKICQTSSRLHHSPLNLPFAPQYIARDGFHPSEEAYAKWADLLAPLILEHL